MPRQEMSNENKYTRNTSSFHREGNPEVHLSEKTTFLLRALAFPPLFLLASPRGGNETIVDHDHDHDRRDKALH